MYWHKKPFYPVDQTAFYTVDKTAFYTVLGGLNHDIDYFSFDKNNLFDRLPI